MIPNGHSILRGCGNLVLAVILLAGSAQGEEARVFTNKDGKTIEAALIGVKGTQAEIRRTDGQVFNLEIVNLCLDDQAWIADWMRAQSGEWKNLRLRLPGPADYAGVIGMNPSMAVERLNESEVDLILPVGAWIELNVFCPEAHGEILEHLVRYDGAGRWDVTVEGRTLLLASDGGPARICGLTMPQRPGSPTGADSTVRDFLASLDRSRLADVLSVELTSTFAPADFDVLGRPVVAVTRDGPFHADALRLVNYWKPKALSISWGKETLDALEEFESLEALELRNDTFRMVNGVRESDYVNREFRLAGVRDLGLIFIPFTTELDRSLATMSGLRLFEQSTPSQSGNSAAAAAPAQWSGIDRFAGLESISVNYDVRLAAREVTALPRLKSIVIGARNLENDPDIQQFADLDGLLQLAIQSSAFDSKILDRWSAAGGLKHLRLFRGYRDDFNGMPALRRLTVYRAPDSRSMDPDVFAALPELVHLSLTNLNADELGVLKSLPAPERLESLRLQGGRFESIDALSSLAGLRRLELSGWEKSPESLDFGGFPVLDQLALYRMTALRELPGLTAHPALRSVRVTDCERLESTGEAFENTTLRLLGFTNCQSLTKLSGFSKCTGLVNINLYNCDALVEPIEIDRLNPSAYINVSGCAQLTDRRPGGPLP